MKNKKNLYFLLPAVLVVWGLVGYRIFKALQLTPVVQQEQRSTMNFAPQPLAASEEFSLQTDYRDPFLGNTKVIKKPKKAVPRKVKQPSKPFPAVTYKGLVSGSGAHQVFIISHNNRQYLLKKGQTQAGFKVVRGNSKTVTLRYEGQQNTIAIAQ